MAPKLLSFLSLAVAILALAGAISAQTAENRSILPKPDDPDSEPKSVKEMLFKMQIEKAKKEYDAMLERGEQALQISKKLEESFTKNNQLSRADLEKLDGLEKLVKKIRGDLGGGDGDEEGADPTDDARLEEPSNLQEGFKSLQSLTVKLVDELKKTTRFSISAVAIQSSNSILRVVRFLRSGR